MIKISSLFSVFLLIFSNPVSVSAQSHYEGKFEQLDPEWRSPNIYRTASGAPGHAYWQQKADYEIDVTLDEDNQRITGTEKVTYTNNSPDHLAYLWLQLDQNMRAKDSDSYSTATNSLTGRITAASIDRITGFSDFDGGHKIQSVKDAEGRDIPFTINKTMMRLDLAAPMKPGESFTFHVDWYYNINDRTRMGGRGGFEYFEEDGNHLFTITQWFPRMAVYSDYQGWQNKQFLGSGEFALPFGDYKVRMTVPADHIVASTGVLQNPEAVLTEKQQALFEESKTASKPVIIVSQKEAERKEKSKATDTKTWIYHADSVRDFAWGSSRKFIWDAMGVPMKDRTVMAMSYYPKEANPLYEQYSTEVVAHTLKVYSKHTIDYPYPVAISVEASNGMEYPMICFNYGRPEKDGTYSSQIKYGMISVIIHEVGHNFFPMIVNSDERQWTWMDEGLNTFVQFLAEQEWDRNYPSRRGPAANMVDYMKGGKNTMVPIMTNSEQVRQFGNNAYGKPATALNILRETVMGRELFDFAFKEFAQRWAFKHPTPEDFFRTMEDASAVDLDWFWKGWFYTTDHVDIAIKYVNHYQLNSNNPDVEYPEAKQKAAQSASHISQQYNAEEPTAVEENPALLDFYNSYDEFAVSNEDRDSYKKWFASLSAEEKRLLQSDLHFYQITFSNEGGLIMPIIVQFNYVDGSSEVERLPAEIWRQDEKEARKVFVKEQEVTSIVIDPYKETADTDLSNNAYPEQVIPSKFQLYKENAGARGASTGGNPMQKKKKK